MRNRRPTWPLLGLTLLFAFGCDGPSEPEFCGSVTPAGFRIVVGGEVTFQWATCRLTGLVVFKDDVQLWGIGGHFSSPVTYGVTPSGASSLGDVSPLEVGETYDVLVIAGSWADWYDFVR